MEPCPRAGSQHKPMRLAAKSYWRRASRRMWHRTLSHIETLPTALLALGFPQAPGSLQWVGSRRSGFGRAYQIAAIQAVTVSGRKRNGRLGVSNRNKQTFVIRYHARQIATQNRGSGGAESRGCEQFRRIAHGSDQEISNGPGPAEPVAATLWGTCNDRCVLLHALGKFKIPTLRPRQ
jgi:hypothetical protein